MCVWICQTFKEHLDTSSVYVYSVWCMTRVQMYFPEDTLRDLRDYARVRGVSVSEVVRSAVVDKFKKLRSKKLDPGKFIGAYKGPIKTNAVKDIHDYYKHGVV